jgi:two-component system sporulation sensor kinase B
MKIVRKVWVIFIFLFAFMFAVGLPLSYGAQTPAEEKITDWQYKWEDGPDKGLEAIESSEGWIRVDSNHSMPEKPAGVTTVWLKINVPHLSWINSGIYMEKFYAQNLTFFLDNRIIYESHRTYLYDINRILLPLEQIESGKTIYIKAETSTERLGTQNGIWQGDYQKLLPSFAKHDLSDIILGSALIFIAIVMIICSQFLNKVQLSSWVSLYCVILAIGMIVITYSPFLYTFYGAYGQIYLQLFDLSLFILLPALTFFFEKVFGGGPYFIISRFRIFQAAYSAFCMVAMLINLLTGSAYYPVYFFLTVTILGIFMIIQFLLIISFSLIYAKKGNKDAMILSVGFSFLALTVIGDLILFYLSSESYDLFLWKGGVVGFIIALIVVLGRRFAKNHEQLLKYSQELEMYNNNIQKSEKMEMISQLAASVAHEVRNPLQVTRGFLQLIAERTTSDKEKNYLLLAIDELDRASNIITDFLTFAKPQLENVTVLNLSEELRHIEVVLVPLANLQGGTIHLDVAQNLYIQGNSSKFKQAFMNMIKNSIEALNGEGQIHLRAYEERNEAVIHIQDNGEGMDQAELAKLGEPYFSNKSKGTGLGLMVTFRIIEVMQGKIEFNSEKGVGTEAVVRFPLVRA